jgi:hypothetical protein
MLFRSQARTEPKVRFLCAPEDWGVIAPPVPAKTQLPAWFRELPAVDTGKLAPTDSGLTVKRCMPFFDAMGTGWILPLAATVRLEISDNGKSVEGGWDFDRTMVSNHGQHQVAGNPKEPRPPCKFHNYWSVRTPPGWSCLFLPPLNRPNPAFECAAGIVDTDTYFAHIHFPFFATGADGLHVLEKGTPIVQVIPFRRDEGAIEGEVAVEADEEAASREVVFRNTIASGGWYRKFARAAR